MQDRNKKKKRIKHALTRESSVHAVLKIWSAGYGGGGEALVEGRVSQRLGWLECSGMQR